MTNPKDALDWYERKQKERMTATERLRELLDERGVEWSKPKAEWWELLGCKPDESVTIVGDLTIEEATDGTLLAYGFTPEQAIAATLGAGTCHADETDTMECVCDGIGHYGEPLTVYVMECSACGGTYEYVNGSYEYCPRCGAKVVAE